MKSTSKAEDYNGPREADDIVAFSKDQASKVGALVEPVAVKKFDELYTFFARSALDSKPAMLFVGTGGEAPEWFSKLHGDLRADSGGFEEDAKVKLREAAAVAKDRSVLASINSVLDEISTKAKASSKPMFSSAFSSDAPVFNSSTLYIAFVDRKNLAASVLCSYSVEKRPAIAKLDAFARAASKESCSLAMPELPKPKSVLAAEERAAKKKAATMEVVSIASPADLDAKCYSLTDRTCALILGSTDGLDALAAKYARNGFAFATLTTDAPSDVVEGLLNGVAEPALVIVKGGKRARAARASGSAANFERLLDDVLGGGASFTKFPSGLPKWPTPDDYDL